MALNLFKAQITLPPKLYIDDFVGVTNRLETLPLAFGFKKAYGRRIILDWPELGDALKIEDTEKEKFSSQPV